MASATPPPASTAVPESEGVGLGPDGEKIVDPSYCELFVQAADQHKFLAVGAQPAAR